MDRPTPVALASPAGRWLVAAAVLGSAVTMLTATVVNVALPAIGSQLGADTAELQWVLNGYLLAVASLILVGGALGDRYGHRRMFVVGTIAFALTSVGGALAPSVGWLIAARVTQGLAAALVTPESLALLETVLRREDRGKAIGAWSALGGIAGAVGPLLGGYLVDVGSWRWVFLLNVPVAVAAVWIALRHLPPAPGDDRGRLDLAGVATVLVGLGGLTFALIRGPAAGLGSPTVWGPLLVGVVALVLFVRIEATTDHPMMPLDLFRKGQFAAGNLVTFVVYTALGGVFFLLVVHLQTSLGLSAMAAGASLLPVTGVMLALSSAGGDFAQRRGARLPLTVGALTLAVAMVLMSRIGPGDSTWLSVLPAVTLFGLGLAATVAPVTATVLSAAPDHRAGAASGINNAVARTAQLLAVAVFPAIAGLSGDGLTDPEALAAGFPRALLAMAAVAALGAVLAWLTISPRPLAEIDAESGDHGMPDGGRSTRHCAVDGPPQRTRVGAGR